MQQLALVRSCQAPYKNFYATVEYEKNARLLRFVRIESWCISNCERFVAFTHQKTDTGNLIVSVLNLATAKMGTAQMYSNLVGGDFNTHFIEFASTGNFLVTSSKWLPELTSWEINVSNDTPIITKIKTTSHPGYCCWYIDPKNFVILKKKEDFFCLKKLFVRSSEEEDPEELHKNETSDPKESITTYPPQDDVLYKLGDSGWSNLVITCNGRKLTLYDPPKYCFNCQDLRISHNKNEKIEVVAVAEQNFVGIYRPNYRIIDNKKKWLSPYNKGLVIFYSALIAAAGVCTYAFYKKR